jgi:hypothetical protein
LVPPPDRGFRSAPKANCEEASAGWQEDHKNQRRPTCYDESDRCGNQRYRHSNPQAPAECALPLARGGEILPRPGVRQSGRISSFHARLTRIRQVWIIRGHCGPGQSNSTGCPVGRAGAAFGDACLAHGPIQRFQCYTDRDIRARLAEEVPEASGAGAPDHVREEERRGRTRGHHPGVDPTLSQRRGPMSRRLEPCSSHHTARLELVQVLHNSDSTISMHFSMACSTKTSFP